ncbi:GNAT family acetyltransferase [Microbacterium sp. gxy059]|uniref:GNAT family acetyltransferase n=1 Tax=Microbacterium sp. gxy059 TaxID=2957199 RepID=UPI003D98B9F8
MTISIRPLADADVESAVALWERRGLTRPWNDPRADIRRARETWPDLLLVADEEGELVGTVMAGYDGHRGWMSYLASTRGGAGIGRGLVREAERRLEALGCPKVMLMVREGNEGVLDWYADLGYGRETVVVAGRRLIADA